MDKELKRLALDILLMFLLLIIVVPICVDASSNYRYKKEVAFGNIGMSTDISNNGDMKKVTVYSNYDKVKKVKLILKISDFFNDYEIQFDGNIYDLNNFVYTSDGEYRYYSLGIYQVDGLREFDF